MNSDAAVGLLSETIKLGLLLSLPLLAVILIVGVSISILQVVTQIQDPSIAFVPKLVLFVLALMALAPWMLGRLVGFGRLMFERLSM